MKAHKLKPSNIYLVKLYVSTVVYMGKNYEKKWKNLAEYDVNILYVSVQFVHESFFIKALEWYLFTYFEVQVFIWKFRKWKTEE